MPIDDTDDKVRRNLIAFSGLIVAAAWLGFPELWLLSQLTANNSTPPAWKVSVLALCVQSYLMARYWFSTAQEAGRTLMKKDWSDILRWRRHQMITAAIKTYHLTKKQPSFITTDLVAFCENETKRKYRDNSKDIELKFTSLNITESSLWNGVIATTRSMRSTSDSHAMHEASGGDTLEFKFPTSLKRRMMMKAAFRQVIYSHTTVEYFVPIVLAVSALIILIVKLVRNLT